jgi:hydrogenase nickel incorporation protein HypA/HybF
LELLWIECRIRSDCRAFVSIGNSKPGQAAALGTLVAVLDWYGTWCEQLGVGHMDFPAGQLRKERAGAEMHELAIAQSILEIVTQSVPVDQKPDVRLIRLKVGKLTGVISDSLKFCFGAIVSDTPLKDASLAIETIPAVFFCPDCGHKFEIEDLAFFCPVCKSINIKMITGSELDITQIELVDEQAEEK